MANGRPVCAIVGAGEGLGASLAKAFAGDGGADIALLGRTPAGSAKAAEAARAAGARVEFFETDARDPAAIDRSLGRVASTLGPVEILLYNARGNVKFVAPLESTVEDLSDALQLEVVGAFAAAKAVLPGMLERGRGTIVYSSATAALRGSARGMVYAAAKFGVRAVAQSLAKAYAAKGVHVAHVRLDCSLDVPIVRQMMGAKFEAEKTSNTDDVAQSYLWIHRQPRSAWSNEIELRPYTEDWTI